MTNIGEYFEQTLFQGINDGIDRPGIVTSLEGTPLDGSFENIRGATGDVGPQGPDGPEFRWEGDVADLVALRALVPLLTPGKVGFTYRVLSDNSVYFWSGSKFIAFTDAFGGIGPTGANNVLSIGTVTTGSVGDPLTVTITGTSPTQTLNLTVPRGGTGEKGLTGPPGPITGSTDWNSAITLTDGMIPLFNSSTGDFDPTEWPGFHGPWSVQETQSWDGLGTTFSADVTNSNTSPRTIAVINIPALPISYRPFVTGGASMCPTTTDYYTRYDLEARLSSDVGTLVGRGIGSYNPNYRYAMLKPYFASSFTAGSSTGTVAANTAATIYVVIKLGAGGGNYNYKRENAHITVWAHPYPTP